MLYGTAQLKLKYKKFWVVIEFALNIFRSCEDISPVPHETNLIPGTDEASHHFQFLEEQSQEHKMSSSHPARIFQSWQCLAEQHSLQLTLT